MGKNRVAQFRLQRGMTSSQLAVAVGVSRQSLHAIETGEQIPKVYLAISIANVLGVEVGELFPEESEERYRIEVDLGGSGSFRACLAEINGQTVIRKSSPAGFGSLAAPADAIVRLESSGYEIESVLGRSGMFLDGCDPVLGIISARSVERLGSFRMRWFYGSNRDSLDRLRNGLTHCALVHDDADSLGDEITNMSSLVCVPFGQWELALCVLPGNPKRIVSLDDLTRKDVKVALREEGSGVRHFLQGALGELGGDLSLLEGSRIFQDHYRVAAAVSLGLCDAGVVPVSVAEAQGLEYVSVGVHQSWLMFSKDGFEIANAGGLFDLVSSRSFAKELGTLGGYQLVG